MKTLLTNESSKKTNVGHKYSLYKRSWEDETLNKLATLTKLTVLTTTLARWSTV